MKRFYLRIVGNFITVYSRPTHQFIKFLNQDVAKAVDEYNELVKMPQEEYYTLLYNLRALPSKIKLETVDAEAEKWYQGAWKKHTETFLKANKKALPMIEEEIPMELIEEIKRKALRNTSGWIFKSQEEPKKEETAPKKLVKLVKKEKVKTPIELLKEELNSGAISVLEFIRKKKLILSEG